MKVMDSFTKKKMQGFGFLASILKDASRGLDRRPLHPFGCIPLKEVSSVRFSRGLCGRPLDSFGFPSDEDVVFRRGLSGRPLHPFGRILLEGVNEWRVMIFPCNTQSLACKATAEGFQGAIGKPLGINIPKQDG